MSKRATAPGLWMYETGASQISSIHSHSSQEFFLRKLKLYSVLLQRFIGQNLFWMEMQRGITHLNSGFLTGYCLFLTIFSQSWGTQKNGFLNIIVCVQWYHVSTQTEEKSKRWFHKPFIHSFTFIHPTSILCTGLCVPSKCLEEKQLAPSHTV